MQLFMEQRRELSLQFNAFTYASDAQGISVAAIPYSVSRIGVDYSDREYLRAALDQGRTVIRKPIMGRTSHATVIVVAVPIKNDQGKVIGGLSGVINMGLPNFFDQITESRHGKTGGFQLVAPQYRLIATATDKRRIMETLPAPGANPLVDAFIQGFEGSSVGVNPQGGEVLASAKGIPVTGWYVVIVMPTAEAFAPIHDMQHRMRIATVILTVLAGLLVWWVLKQQLSPLLSTARKLANMSDESQPMRPLPILRDDEIGQLIGGFNRLLEIFGQRENLLKQIMDTSSVAIFLVDMDGRIAMANQRMAEMFGRPLKDLVGSEYMSLVPQRERMSRQQMLFSLLASDNDSVTLDRHYLRADASEFWGYVTVSRFHDSNGVDRGLIGVISDITERKRSEESLQLAASVFTHSREGILITEADGTIIDINESFTRITGYSREEVLGRNPRILKSEHHGPEFYLEFWRVLLEKGFWSGEVWNRRKNGELYPEFLTISAVRDENGITQHYVALVTDISPLKAHERQLEKMAHFDALTMLPNRVLLADRLHQAMAQAQRRGQRLAVVYLDLDGFKAVNDMHGHKVGDQLLIALANRMKQALREGDTLARMGGDEFVIVLLDLGDIHACAPMLDRLLSAASLPLTVDDFVLRVSASLGVTFYPQAEEADADQLLRQADQAIYQAKLAGRNRYHFFDAEQDRNMRGHHENLERIRIALDDRQFVLHYQPKVNMRTGQVVGAEALIRWQHPERGLLLPGAFLPVVENHQLAIDIGEWVITTALTQIEAWRAAGLNLPISVNVSARQLQQWDFALCLRELLSAHPTVDPADLELEVLETSALEDLERASMIIEHYQDLGVNFALDDFGTGYSSLTYLKRLSVNQLKIGPSFVRDMVDDPDDLSILEGIIGLAEAFRRRVIAEGVETVEHRKMLLQLGCELAQGYGIARPMPADELPAWVAGDPPRAGSGVRRSTGRACRYCSLVRPTAPGFAGSKPISIACVTYGRHWTCTVVNLGRGWMPRKICSTVKAFSWHRYKNCIAIFTIWVEN